MMSNFSKFLSEDYQLTDSEETNYEFLYNHLSKTKVRQLRSDIKNSVKYLNKLLQVEDYPYKTEFYYWQKKFHKWQKTISQINLNKFADRNSKKNLEWFYLCISLYFLFDAFHHVFSRFTEMNDRCFWCNTDMTIPWTDVLVRVMSTSLPAFYVYLSLAQKPDENIDNIFYDFLNLFNAIINL